MGPRAMGAGGIVVGIVFLLGAVFLQSIPSWFGPVGYNMEFWVENGPLIFTVIGIVLIILSILLLLAPRSPERQTRT
jgi:hypothetical protein